MTTRMRAKVTGRHAITLPAALCRELDIEAGDSVEFEVTGNQAMLIKASQQESGDIRGILQDLFPDWESVESFIAEERSGWDRTAE